jgi:hypothetical protein
MSEMCWQSMSCYSIFVAHTHTHQPRDAPERHRSSASTSALERDLLQFPGNINRPLGSAASWLIVVRIYSTSYPGFASARCDTRLVAQSYLGSLIGS